MSKSVQERLRCELPIQLAPMGSVAATPALPLAVAAAGGHGMYPALGLPPAALAPVVHALADRTAAFGVIAAGGIATARGVAAALAAGAEGVRVGTRFIAASESDAHAAWVRAVIDAGPEEAVVSTAFNVGLPEPGPHRVLRRSIEAAEALDDEQAGVLRLAGAEIPVARFGAQPPTRESTGAVEAMPFYAGQSAGAVRSVQPAAEIVADLARAVTGHS